MGAVASQITSLTIVYSTVNSDADQRKHQSSTPLAFVRGIHRGPVNSPHKWPVTRKMFPLMTSSWWMRRAGIQLIRVWYNSLCFNLCNRISSDDMIKKIFEISEWCNLQKVIADITKRLLLGKFELKESNRFHKAATASWVVKSVA